MPMWLKRLIRPLVPDRIMARYRLHQHSRQVRSNVDVFVSSDREVRRWLATTPDTYRVGVLPEGGAPRGDPVALGDPSRLPALRRALAESGVSAVFAALTDRPRLVGRRRVEPSLRPIAALVSAEAMADVDAGAGDDLTGLWHRLANAGHRLALLPEASAEVDPRRHDPIEEPVAVVLAAVPIHDVGGGGRGAQIALELLRRGFHVVFVALAGTHESVDLGLRFVHRRLEQQRADQLRLPTLVARADRGGLILVEVPAPVYLDAVAAAPSEGWTVCYDVIDLWSDPALGGDWYRRDVEERFLRQADAVVVSAPDLMPVAAAVGRETVVIPNAVNAAVFGVEPGPAPEDLPSGDGPLFGYHGSLYGDWFDWEAVVAVAERWPDGRVVLIGDPPARRRPLPGNVHLLGLKAQADLPAYVCRFDVGLLPFVVSPTTHAVSPLKVFEYLACGVPVAAPPLRSLDGLDGVHRSAEFLAAVEAALSAPRPDRGRALEEHSWARRVEELLAVTGVVQPESPAEPARVVVRPVTHWSRSERRL